MVPLLATCSEIEGCHYSFTKSRRLSDNMSPEISLPVLKGHREAFLHSKDSTSKNVYCHSVQSVLEY
jgi:hypothetical protein